MTPRPRAARERRRPAAAPSLPSIPARDRRAWRITLAAAAGWSALHAAIAVHKLRHFLFSDFDLAIFTQAMAQLLRGSLDVPIRGMAWPGDHASLILFALAPLWALAPHPSTLLIVQSVALGAVALAVHRLARRELGDPALACGMAILALLQPALSYLAQFEFHPETLAVAPLVVAFDEARRGRAGRAALAAGIAALCREDVALALLALAAYAWLARRATRTALAIAAVAAASLVVTFAWLRPAFGAGADYAGLYAAWGDGLSGIARGLLSRPLDALAGFVSTPASALDTSLKRELWLHLLLPLGGLPLAGLASLIALPVLAEHLWSSRLAQHTIVFQYTAAILPFLIAGAVLAIARLARRRGAVDPARGRVVLGAALLAAIGSNVLFGAVGGLGVTQSLRRPEPIRCPPYAADLLPHRERMLARVPRDGVVIAGMEFLPRLAARPGTQSLHHVLGGRLTWSDVAVPIPDDVGAVLGDLGAGSLLGAITAETPARWRALIERNRLVAADAVEDHVLWLRGAPDTLGLLRVLPDRSAASAAPLVWESALALHGARLPDQPLAPGSLLELATVWSRGAPIERPVIVQLLAMREDGRPGFELLRHLGYTWAPPATWPADTLVAERYRCIVPRALAAGRYRLGLRVWIRERADRLAASDDPRLAANGMVADLGGFEVTAR